MIQAGILAEYNGTNPLTLQPHLATFTFHFKTLSNPILRLPLEGGVPKRLLNFDPDLQQCLIHYLISTALYSFTHFLTYLAAPLSVLVRIKLH